MNKQLFFFRVEKFLTSALRFVAHRILRLKFSQDDFVIYAADASKKKLDDLLIRLSFYLPDDVQASKIKVTSKLPLREVFFGVVLVLDQNLMHRRYLRICPNIFNVDMDCNPVDGWDLCGVSQYARYLPSPLRTEQAYRKFFQVVEKLKSKISKVYVFGTGISLEKSIERDFSDGAVIVCNTIARDAELWHHLKPDIFVAGDAIYHFGFTEFAVSFRRDLRERLRETKVPPLFVYPELFDAIVQKEFAEFAEILIPIPFGAHNDVHVDLMSQFELPALGNVLNILLLPVACTLSRSVFLWGFDGRAPDDKLFWSNSAKHSYPELMGSLQVAHPAFFENFVPKNKENNYVNSVHGDQLEICLARAEQEGISFVMMHRSWTPTLNRRYAEPR